MNEDRIKEIVCDLRPEFNFCESDNFIDDGYLDSFDIVSLIASLEDEFDIVVDGLDIIPENFVSFNTITNLVKKSSK